LGRPAGALHRDNESQAQSVDWSASLLDGVAFTWLDLLMPYLQWEDVNYLGPDRYLGRPAHRYELLNPDGGSFPARVVVTLDEDYAAMLKVDLYDSNHRLQKRMRIGGFKKFEDNWMASELNWEDRPARSSVKLNVYSFMNTP